MSGKENAHLMSVRLKRFDQREDPLLRARFAIPKWYDRRAQDFFHSRFNSKQQALRRFKILFRFFDRAGNTVVVVD